jgi:RNase P subunit RPR2
MSASAIVPDVSSLELPPLAAQPWSCRRCNAVLGSVIGGALYLGAVKASAATVECPACGKERRWYPVAATGAVVARD